MKNKFPIVFCIIFLTIFFTLFFFLPLFIVLYQGMNPGVLLEVIKNRIYQEGLLNSFAISILTTFFIFLISLPLAVLYNHFEFPGKSLCPILMMTPMILPPFVGALGFQQLLGHYGVLNSIITACGMTPVDFLGGNGRFFGICIIEALHLYPILYLNLITALANIEPDINDAAKNLGIPPLKRFFYITLPLLRPGIFAGGSIVLIWSFTELGTPLMFGFNTVTPVQVFNALTQLGDHADPFALVVLLLIVASVLYLLGHLMIGSNTSTPLTKGAIANHANHLTGCKKFLPIGAFLLFTTFAALPHITLILTAFSKSWYQTILPLHYTLIHFRDALSHDLVVPSIQNSLIYSSVATVLACAAGLATAWLVKRSRIKFAGIFDFIGMLPLMIPGLVIAVGFLGMFIQIPFLRIFFNPIENPILLIASAYAIRRVPYVLRSVSSGLEQTPVDLENAARSLGYGQLSAFLKITVPLVTANLIVGALFTFSFSMMEVSDSLLLAHKTEFFPITKAIYALTQYLGNGYSIASAFGVWAMAFLAATLFAAGLLIGRKIGSLFKL